MFKPDALTVFIIMSDENIDRIKDYDPMAIEWDKLPEECKNCKLDAIHLCYASNAEGQEIVDAGQRGDFKGLIQLVRNLGRNFRVKAGDHDGPYTSIKPTEDSFGA